uniref:Uncharacterized protein n=1 Tax=Arundo donax TaxID=35708 RepID=A0A0A9H0J8_ARUDO
MSKNITPTNPYPIFLDERPLISPSHLLTCRRPSSFSYFSSLSSHIPDRWDPLIIV